MAAASRYTFRVPLKGTKPPGAVLWCTYTDTQDDGFVIDRHPELERLIVVSACSGHGFKHSLAVGEIATQMASNETHIEVVPFKLQRLTL